MDQTLIDDPEAAWEVPPGHPLGCEGGRTLQTLSASQACRVREKHPHITRPDLTQEQLQGQAIINSKAIPMSGSPNAIASDSVITQ